MQTYCLGRTNWEPAICAVKQGREEWGRILLQLVLDSGWLQPLQAPTGLKLHEPLPCIRFELLESASSRADGLLPLLTCMWRCWRGLTYPAMLLCLLPKSGTGHLDTPQFGCSSKRIPWAWQWALKATRRSASWTHM